MTEPSEEVLREILKLLEAAKEDRHKAQQRIEAATRARDVADRKIEAYELTLKDLRTALGLFDPDEVADPKVAQAFSGLSLREMLTLWANTHDGELIMRDMSKTLVGAGLFRNSPSAAGSLYSTLERMPGFEKVKRGHYRLRAAPDTNGDGEAWRTVLEPEDLGLTPSEMAEELAIANAEDDEEPF